MQKSNNWLRPQILIVDDDKVVSLLQKNLIRKVDPENQPLLFSDGNTALEQILRMNKPGQNFLIFLDLNMPVMDGWQFLKKIQNSRILANITVVVVTSSVRLEDFVRALDFRQVVAFCRKPLTATAIEDLVHHEKVGTLLKSTAILQEISQK